jgi:hypothetical protein
VAASRDQPVASPVITSAATSDALSCTEAFTTCASANVNRVHMAARVVGSCLANWACFSARGACSVSLLSLHLSLDTWPTNSEARGHGHRVYESLRQQP